MTPREVGGSAGFGREKESGLGVRTKAIAERCNSCGLCQKECAFLRKYGSPQEIARNYGASHRGEQAIAFECSLCRLCAAVCPEKLDPAGMFWDMRCEKRRFKGGDYPEHAGALAFERRGTSRRFTFYALPAGCKTILFPGCALPGTRPGKTFRLYEEIKKNIPTIGIVLDCCLKTSHDLGRGEFFQSGFQEMEEYLLKNGVRQILVACPNCYRIFSEYGKEFTVRTVYEFLAENMLGLKNPGHGTVAIHDPCVVRFEPKIHSAVRQLVHAQGVAVQEMPHHGQNTLCCGEGGLVGGLSPDLERRRGGIIQGEAGGKRVITYCAGCAQLLNQTMPANHLLDLVFERDATLAGKARASSPPITYLNRLRLKKRLKQAVHASVIRERSLPAGRQNGKKRLALLGAILAKEVNAMVKKCGVWFLLTTLIWAASFAVSSGQGASKSLPLGKENPIMIDEREKSLSFLTEVNGKYLFEPTRHGVVFKEGKNGDKSIFRAFVTPKDLHDNLIKLGFKPGNNMTMENKETTLVKGDLLNVTVTWEGVNKRYRIDEVIQESNGKPLLIRFGGNLSKAVQYKTGCLLCLDSCPVGILSNASYTYGGVEKRKEVAFRGRKEVLPPDGTRVVVTVKRNP